MKFSLFSGRRRSHSAFKFCFCFLFKRMNMKVVLNSVILIIDAVLFTNCYVIPCLYCNFIHEVHAHLIINFATWIKIILLGSFDQFRHILTKTILSNQASISQLRLCLSVLLGLKGNYIVLFAPIKYHSYLESFRTVLKSKVLVLFLRKILLAASRHTYPYSEEDNPSRSSQHLPVNAPLLLW